MLNFIRGVTRPGLAWLLVLAVVILTGIDFWRNPQATIPDRLWDLALMGASFYLGARTAERKA